MSKAGRVALLLLAGLVGAGATAEEGTTPVQSSPYPPKNLKLVGDHWTPWEPPAAGPDDYIIVRGDTLWDLSQKWLNDPYLWPQIWDQNKYVLDSHWIYPGDPLKVPGKPNVVPAEGPPVPAEEPAAAAATPPAAAPAAPASPAAPPLLPVADASDVNCMGYILPEPPSADVTIVGREMERIAVAQGDVIYLGRGRDAGIAPGAVFRVERIEGEVLHPSDQHSLGRMVRRLGKARVLVVQESTAIAVLEQSCDDIRDGDALVAWQEVPIPRLASLPQFQRYDVDPNGQPVGWVVAAKDEVTATGTGQIVHLDLAGREARPGDVIKLFREEDGVPRRMLGQAVVLTVEPGTVTAKVTASVREILIGDRVEALQ